MGFNLLSGGNMVDSVFDNFGPRWGGTDVLKSSLKNISFLDLPQESSFPNAV